MVSKDAPKEEPTDRDDTKLIKHRGNGGLTRTSQACDRCRIKKIKCDGKIPSCTNCLNIGYNCQTSDKLTRRAFPRGYTENLEKNLISLQNENARLITELELIKRGKQPSEPVQEATPVKRESVVSIVSATADPVDDDLFEGRSHNFFRYSNYIDEENYVGLNCLNALFDEVVTSMNLSPVEELHYPAIESASVYDFITTKFLSKFPSKTNLDLLISNHFEHLNLIPILDEDSFFKFYKEVFNSIDNKTENLKDLFTQPDPAGVSEEDRMVFISTLVMIIQLNCSIFSIHEIHKLVTSLNLSINVTIPKFQALLLALYLFHNKNCYKNTVINLTNIAHAGVMSLGLHLNYNNLHRLGSAKQLSKEEKFRAYAVRLKLYWSFYILSTISGIFFGLPQVGFFDRFHVPKLVTLLNANQNLKHTLALIDILEKFEDINLLSIGEDPQKLKDVDQLLVNWRKDLGLNTFFSKLATENAERTKKRQKKQNYFSPSDVVQIQLNMFYLTLRMSIHLQTAFNKDSVLSGQSCYVISSLAREFLAYIILLDRKRELNNLNNFEFHLVPINFLKFSLISILSIVKLAQEFTKHASSLINDAAKLVTQTLKVIKNRYPENFVLFKELVTFIKKVFSVDDPQLDYETLDAQPCVEYTTAPPERSNLNTAALEQLGRHASTGSLDSASSSSVSSIFHQDYNVHPHANAAAALDHLPRVDASDTSSVQGDSLDLGTTSHLDLLFDWNNVAGVRAFDSRGLMDHKSMTAYDLGYIIDKSS